MLLPIRLFGLLPAVGHDCRLALLFFMTLLLAGPAQAQFVVDGRASTSEIGPGKYQLVSTYTGPHSVPDRGLKSLYVARTATTLNIMMVASPTLATDYSSLVLYLNAPGRTGTPVGTRLAGSAAIESPLYHQPKLDLEADYGLRLTTSATGVNNDSVYYSYVDYTTPPTAAGRTQDRFLGATTNNGRARTVAAGGMAGAQLAYTNTAGIAANTSTGWEMQIPLAALGAQGGSALDVFAAFTSSAGEFTTDLFPPIAGRTTPLGLDPDFTAIPGTQALRLNALTIDGRIDANEIGAGVDGLYRLVGEYTTPHPAGFGDYGLTKLYMAHSATKVYLFAVGTVETNGNTFQLYFNVPGLAGVPRGTALPGVPASAGSSFQNMRARLDLETDLGLALQGGVLNSNPATPGVAVNVVRYAGPVAERQLSPGTAANGTPVALASPTITQFNGAVMAYRSSPSGMLSGNPGNFGWEMELDRAALGVPASLPNATLQAFLLQNNSDGDFLSTDMIPATPGIGTTNPGLSSGVDFPQLPGRQALTYAFSCPTAVALAYGAGAYCQSGSVPAPTVTGPAGGAFSSTAGLSMNAATGVISSGASAPGTYTVSYNADVVNCPTIATTQVTITRTPLATFGYGAPAYCSAATTVAATMAANATAGTFSASPAGLNLNPSTGAINLGTSASGTYTVVNTVAAAGGCGATSAGTTVVVNARPAAPTLSAQYNGATTTLTSSAAIGNQFYLNGAVIAGATAQTYVVNGTPTQLGAYSVVVTNGAGCASAPSAPLTVTTSLPALAGSALTVYPTITTGQVTVELRGYHPAVELSLLNALGQVVAAATLSAAPTTATQSLNLTHLPSGVYTLRAKTTNGLNTRRVVKE